MPTNETLQPMYDYDRQDLIGAWQVLFHRAPQRLQPLLDTLMSYPGRGDASFSRVPEGIAHVVCLIGHDASAIREASLLVSGPHDSKHPMMVASETLVAQLRPGAARALLGFDAAAIANQVVPAEALWGQSARDTLDAIVAMPSRAARLRVFTTFLEQRVARPPEDDLFAMRAAAWMQTQPGGTCIRTLSAHSGYSERQMRRKFKESLGMSPKAYARTLRLRAVLQSGSSHADWGAIAASTGFYDQSHLIHDFKAAFGAPPGVFFENPRLSAMVRLGILDES